MVETKYILNNQNEIKGDEGKFLVIGPINDQQTVNPFISGTTSFTELVNGDISSGVVSDVSGFLFVASGEPFENPSGLIYNFSFSSPRVVKKVNLYQNPDNYATAFGIIADGTEIFYTANSTNSGTVTVDLNTEMTIEELSIKIDKINPIYTYYHLLEVSGEAYPDFVESALAQDSYDSVTATSNVEPAINMIDDNSLTFWQSNNSFPQEVELLFDKAYSIAQFEYEAEDTATYPITFELYAKQGSTSDYVLVVERNLSNPVSGVLYSHEFSPVINAVAFKWKITGGVGQKVRVKKAVFSKREFPQTDENKIKLLPQKVDLLQQSIYLSTSNTDGSNVIANVENTNTAVYYKSLDSFVYDASSETYTGNVEILIDGQIRRTVNEIVITNATGTGLIDSAILYGSDDNIAYTALKSFYGNKNQTILLSFQEGSEPTYRFYKLIVSASNASHVRIDTMKVFSLSYPTQSGPVTLPPVIADRIHSVSGEVVVPTGTSVRYQLTLNNQKYWYNGNSWVVAAESILNTNDIATVNNNLSKILLGENMTVQPTVYLQSDGTATPTIKDVVLVTDNEKNSINIPENNIRIKGYLSLFPGSNKKLTMEIGLRLSHIKVGTKALGFNVTKIVSDENGYFDFTLPITENAIPEKARFSVVISEINYRAERWTPDKAQLDLSDWIAGNY